MSDIYATFSRDDLIEMNTGLEKRIAYLEQRLAAAESRTCELQEDSDTDSGAWLGDCGAKWTFIVGGPEENSCVYCPQCGGKLVVSECQVKEDSGKGK